MLQIFRQNPKKQQNNLHSKFDIFSQKLVQAFAQVKTDMENINSKLDSQKNDLDRMGQWISYLHKHGQRISDSHEKLWKKQAKIEENNQKIHSSHREFVETNTRLSENIANKHKELSEQILNHKTDLKSTVNSTLENHKELTKREIDSLKGWISHISTNLESQSQKSEGLKQDMFQIQNSWKQSENSFNSLIDSLRQENVSLHDELSKISNSHISDKELLSETINKSENKVKSHIEELKSEINTLKSSSKLQVQHPSNHLQPVQQQVSIPQSSQPVSQAINSQPFTSSGFERHIISRVMPNRRGYVLKFILNLVAENRFSTKEIEEMVVKEKNLCGRTSFYAYLKELRIKGQIATAHIDERPILISAERQETLSSVERGPIISDVVRRNHREKIEKPKERDFDDMVDEFHDE